MAIEKYWTRQGPIAFTQDGTESGLITVSDVAFFKVKQRIVVSSDSQPDLQLQIKRIPSLTQIIVGPLKDDKQRNIKNLNLRTDLSNYTVADNAMIRAEEQSKVTIPRDDIWQAVYEFEPTVAIRTIGVDKLGQPYELSNPLPVQLSDVVEILETVTKNSVFSKQFNKLEVLSKDDDGNPLEIKTSYNGVGVQLATIEYDLDGDLVSVETEDL